MEYALALMRDLAQLAVHGRGAADDRAAEGLPDGLMPEADAEHGNPAGGLLDEIEADAGLVRRARTGREDDALRRHGHRLVDGEGVVALDRQAGTQFTQKVVEVVGEAVV